MDQDMVAIILTVAFIVYAACMVMLEKKTR